MAGLAGALVPACGGDSADDAEALPAALLAGIQNGCVDLTSPANYHWKQLPLPKWSVGMHAGAAVLGFALLVAATFNR